MRKVKKVKQANLPDSKTEASFFDGPEPCSMPRHLRFYTFYFWNLGRIKSLTSLSWALLQFITMGSVFIYEDPGFLPAANGPQWGGGILPCSGERWGSLLGIGARSLDYMLILVMRTATGVKLVRRREALPVTAAPPLLLISTGLTILTQYIGDWNGYGRIRTNKCRM